MWVFLNDAFLSIVAHRTKPGHLMVRARLEGDLARVFPTALVVETPDADYRWRCTVTKLQAQRAITAAVKDVDYPNFKDSVREDFRHDAYMGVWSVMHRAQDRQAPMPSFNVDGW